MHTRRSHQPTSRPRGARLRDYLLAIGLVLGIGAVGLSFGWWQQWRLAALCSTCIPSSRS
ncbi:MAG: hypothetical protein HGA45_24395 [Chloroflexales bacterium]|nr:hypothetical protein [Chloroflexales bacterium]